MLRRYLRRSLCFDSDGGSGGGSVGDESSGSSGGGSSGRDVPLDTDVLVAKYGDARAALAKVVSKLDDVEADNAKYRQQIRDLKANQPADDALVLDAGQQEALRERGLLTEEGELKPEAFDEKAERAQRADELEQKETLRTAAEAAGITSFEAFEGLVNGEDFEVEEGDEDEAPTVTVIHEEDGEERRTPLEKYERFKPYHAALFGEQQEQEKESGPSYPQITPVTKENKPGPSGTTVEEIKKRKQQSGDYAL